MMLHNKVPQKLSGYNNKHVIFLTHGSLGWFALLLVGWLGSKLCVGLRSLHSRSQAEVAANA